MRPTRWFWVALAGGALSCALASLAFPKHAFWLGFAIGAAWTLLFPLVGLPVWKRREFVLPTHCFACGAYLMGSATQHARGCRIRKFIEETEEMLRRRREP